MTLETLHIMPALEKQINTNNYKYPDKYIGKIYKFNDNNIEKYIYFESNKYYAFPASAIDLVLDSKIHQLLEESKPNENDQLTKIDTYVRKILSTSFDGINRSIDNINESLRMKIEEKDLIQLIETIIANYTSDFIDNNTVKNLITNAIENFITDDDLEQTLNHRLQSNSLKQIEDLTSNLESVLQEINTIKDDFKSDKHKNKFEEIQVDLNMMTSRIVDLKKDILNKEQILEIITEELKLVHDNLPSMVNELVSKRISEAKGITEKLSMGKVFALKEGGLTIEEIVKLHEKGLI